MIRNFQNRFAVEFRKWKKIILFCTILNALAYGTYITNITYATDDYCFVFSKIDNAASGRWFAGLLYNHVFKSCFMPTLSPFICFASHLLTGIGLCKLWKIKKKSCLLLVALWSLHPYLLETYNFRVATVNYALAYLMTILSLLIVKKGKAGFLSATILFYLALSIYQVVLGFAVSAMMTQMLFLCYRGGFSKKSLFLCRKHFLPFCWMLLLSIVSYLVTNKFIFLLTTNTRVDSRIEAGFISNMDQVYPKICWTIKMLFVRILPIREYVLPLTGKLIVLVVYIGAVFSVLKKYPKRFLSLLLLIWIILIPIGAILFILPLAASSLPWRTCTGLVVFFVGMFGLTQESCTKSVQKVCFWASVILVIYFILISNMIWYKQYLLNQKDLFIANRIIAKIQALEEYKPGMELAMLGQYQRQLDLKPRSPGRWDRLIEDIRHLSATEYSFNVSAFSRDWSKYCFLLNYLDAELVRCSKDNLKKALDVSQGRNAWPDPSSVFIRDGVVIVILSDPASN